MQLVQLCTQHLGFTASGLTGEVPTLHPLDASLVFFFKAIEKQRNNNQPRKKYICFCGCCSFFLCITNDSSSYGDLMGIFTVQNEI